MRSFHFEAHTADIRMRISGETLPELFKVAMEGMAELISKGSVKKGKFLASYDIFVSSENSTFLLIDFLSEILTLSHIHHMIFGEVEFLKFDETALKARIGGRKVKKFEEDLKAVSYHEAGIRKNSHGLYETVIVFDI